MKILLLLILTSCSSLSQKEPWSKGDCVEYQERKTYFKIVDEPVYKKSLNPEKPYEWFYRGEVIRKETLPKKVMKRINCNSLPKEK